MITEELVVTIKFWLENGASHEQITIELMNAGWHPTHITKAVEHAKHELGIHPHHSWYRVDKETQVEKFRWGHLVIIIILGLIAIWYGIVAITNRDAMRPIELVRDQAESLLGITPQAPTESIWDAAIAMRPSDQQPADPEIVAFLSNIDTDFPLPINADDVRLLGGNDYHPFASIPTLTITTVGPATELRAMYVQFIEANNWSNLGRSATVEFGDPRFEIVAANQQGTSYTIAYKTSDGELVIYETPDTPAETTTE